jgi:hypothetical protein
VFFLVWDDGLGGEASWVQFQITFHEFLSHKSNCNS